jgi:hypothetical protein
MIGILLMASIWSGIPSDHFTFPDNYPAHVANASTIAHWDFSETASPLVDEIGSLSLAEAGSPTYNQSIANAVPYEEINPFATLTTEFADYFTNTSPGTQMDVGTSDFSVKAWIHITDGSFSASGAYPILSTQDLSVNEYGYKLRMSRTVDTGSPGGSNWRVRFDIYNPADGVAKTVQTDTLEPNVILNSSFPVEILAQADRDSATGLKIFINGVEHPYTTQEDPSSLSAADIKCGRADIGFDAGSFATLIGSVGELVVSKSLLTSSIP